MENQKKSKGMTALVVLLLIVTIAALVLATYAWAKYTSTENGTAVANVAKWNVTFNNDEAVTISSQSHVVTGLIAPGSKGTFNVVPVPNDTQVCFNYTIKITDIYLVNGDTKVTAITTEGNALTAAELTEFYTHIVVKNNNTTLTVGGANPTAVNGTYNLGSHNNTTGAVLDGVTVFNWEWKYEDTTDNNYDIIDTKVGKAVTNGDVTGLKFEYTITATQVNPQEANH